MSNQILTLTPILRVFDTYPDDGKIHLNDQRWKLRYEAGTDVHEDESSSPKSTNSDDCAIKSIPSPSPDPDDGTIVVAIPTQQSDGLQSEKIRVLKDHPNPERRGRKALCFRYREEHHLTLYLLRTTFKGSWDQTTRIFNKIFEQDITEYGLHRGPLRTALMTQFTSRHNIQRALWQTFRKEVKSNRRAFKDIKNRIETTLSTNNITIKALRPKKKARRTCIKREEAHPPLPVVLFRAYNDASQGSNSAEGFVASYFEDHDGIPLPPDYSDHDLENTIRKHLSRHEDLKSPFISTSSCLIKVMRRAIKASEKAQNLDSCRISIIDTHKVQAGQGDSIFYARPYRDPFRTRGLFPWRYSAEEEYLVWGGIPRTAMIADLSLQGLLSFIAEDPVLSHAFETDVSAGEGVKEMRRTLKTKQIPLSSELVAGIARLIASLCMEIDTSPAIIAKLVCEVIHGWCIVLPVQPADSWLAEAAVFAHSFIDSQDCVVVGHEEKYFPDISEAFLAGARTSTKSWIAHIELNQGQAEAQEIVDRAVRVGLLSTEEKFSRSTVE